MLNSEMRQIEKGLPHFLHTEEVLSYKEWYLRGRPCCWTEGIRNRSASAFYDSRRGYLALFEQGKLKKVGYGTAQQGNRYLATYTDHLTLIKKENTNERTNR